MNAPFRITAPTVRPADLADRQEFARLERFVMEHPAGTPFHRPTWLTAVASGTGNHARALVEERGGEVIAYLPLLETHSPLFGRVLVSSGFGVEGGILATADAGTLLIEAAEELALRRVCSTIELRGGVPPADRHGWTVRHDTHCGFVAPLASDDDAQLLAIPRKQRAEVRKGLGNELEVSVGAGPEDRAAHYAIYAESVRNLGTPVFPRSLFDAVLDAFAGDADILTVRHNGAAVASVLSLYHQGSVMPYWGGGTRDARRLRANDVMYYALMLHARGRGCDRFDFGRSKAGSGAHDFKKNWGFEPQPLGYASWTAPGCAARDADPTSAKHAAQIALWRKLPLAISNRLGPLIARGLA